MNKLSLLSAFFVSSLILSGCGSEPDSSAPDINVTIENPDGGGGGGATL